MPSLSGNRSKGQKKFLVFSHTTFCLPRPRGHCRASLSSKQPEVELKVLPKRQCWLSDSGVPPSSFSENRVLYGLRFHLTPQKL